MSTAIEEKGVRVGSNPPWIPDTDSYETALALCFLEAVETALKK